MKLQTHSIEQNCLYLLFDGRLNTREDRIVLDIMHGVIARLRSRAYDVTQFLRVSDRPPREHSRYYVDVPQKEMRLKAHSFTLKKLRIYFS